MRPVICSHTIAGIGRDVPPPPPEVPYVTRLEHEPRKRVRGHRIAAFWSNLFLFQAVTCVLFTGNILGNDESYTNSEGRFCFICLGRPTKYGCHFTGVLIF